MNNLPENTPRVLIVDDEKLNINVLNSILKDDDRIKVALDGAQALQRAMSDPLPYIILLDILMPGMDGFEVCRELKENEQIAGIPVIFISARQETIDKVKAFSLGGVDYINKPFEAEEVRARIKTHLALHFLQQKMEKKNAELQKALDEIKTLRGILPFCCVCGLIRDDTGVERGKGEWMRVEEFVTQKTDAMVSHGYCPKCLQKAKEGM